MEEEKMLTLEKFEEASEVVLQSNAGDKTCIQ